MCQNFSFQHFVSRTSFVQIFRFITMGSKKIIVPQGLINPNETTIIEIPAGVDSEATLIARSSPRTCEEMFQPGCASTPRTRRVTTVPPARPQSACPGSGGGGGGRQMRQVTSTTIITNEDDSSSLGILDSNYMNSSGGRSGGRSGQQSSLGVLGSGYMDGTGLCPASRNATMGSGYMDSTRTSDNGGCMSGGGNYMDSSGGRTNNTMGILGSGYMDSTRSTNQSSFGVLGSGYMDSTRSTNQSSLGILGSGYMDSTRCGGGVSASPSPKRVKKIVKKVVTETPQSSNNSHSLGLLPNSYMNDTNLSLCGRSGGSESKKKVTRVTSETIIDEGDSQESAGLLNSGYFDSTHSSGASRSMGLLPGAYLDSPAQQDSCPSRRAGRRCPGSAGSNRSQGGGGGNSTQQNLTMEVQRHLSELEQNERNQINRDLVMFQQARRRLVHDATNISSSGESQMNFSGGNSSSNNKRM
ncbi:PREDICTED: uncharacterized transmembrane protein DDB_G0289901-like [Nicrophorus vespilloides]|uniref:Uncharacterized transmembrane protein DDB_G0289901-like n=1 Tax=Nicrophorus vespilloides TaxID=110193 RepID=A0ABM1MCY8_NICVS|nr:PREDICTED: uncharacterized transmembrane protein DDB_G0289901-like [Nicrophorus vespilloides]